MSRIVSAVEFAWRWWACACGVVFLVLACLVGVGMSRARVRERDFIQARVQPLAGFVTSFRDAHGRLPTEADFREWVEKNPQPGAVEYYPQRPDFVADWGTPGRDFLVGAWRGQWMLYYRSWDGKDFAGAMPSILHSPAHG